MAPAIANTAATTTQLIFAIREENLWQRKGTVTSYVFHFFG
jgi:hypothetical protein